MIIYKWSYFIKNKKTEIYEPFTGTFDLPRLALNWYNTHGQWFIKKSKHSFLLVRHKIIKGSSTYSPNPQLLK